MKQSPIIWYRAAWAQYYKDHTIAVYYGHTKRSLRYGVVSPINWEYT